MSGLFAQNAVLESQLKNLRHSPLLHLRGNQKPGVPDYKTATAAKILRGIINNADYYNFGGYATQYDFYVAQMPFQTLTDVYADADGNSYTGISSIDLAHNCPTSSGYPAGTDGSGAFIGTSYPWGIRPPISSGALFNPPPPPYLPITDTVTPWYRAGEFTPACTSTLSSAMDFSGVLSPVKSDLLGVTWTWSVSVFKLSYNEPSGTFNGSSADISSLTPASFDLSLINTAGDGFTPGIAQPAIISYPKPTYPFNTITPIPMATGWKIEGAPGRLKVYSGLAKNTAGPDLPYFIARMQWCFPNLGDPSLIDSGVTTTSYKLTLYSVGIIGLNKVIGIGQDVDIPFPTGNPFPLQTLGNNAVQADFYFAVIADNPTSWAARNFLSFGEVTFVTP